MGVSWIMYKGKKILYMDLRHLEEDDMINELEKTAEIINASQEKVLLLGDIRNSTVTNRFFIWLQNITKNILQSKTERGAVLGIDESNKILLERFNFTLKANLEKFETEVGAKEYLVK